jgi:hypothetical protein
MRFKKKEFWSPSHNLELNQQFYFSLLKGGEIPCVFSLINFALELVQRPLHSTPYQNIHKFTETSLTETRTT